MKNKAEATTQSSNELVIAKDGLAATPEDLLAIATTLVTQLQARQMGEAKQTIYQLCQLQEKSLFHEIGKLTRKMHESLNHFAHDENLETLMQESLPDAKKRLDYVVQLTEESANKTLNAVEQCMPISSSLKADAQYLQQQMNTTDKDKNTANMVSGSNEEDPLTLHRFLSRTVEQSDVLNNCLTEILMAQTFQDVTGQIIQRVIKLVKEVEDSLVAMIRTCGISAGGSENTHYCVSQAGDGKKDNRGYGPAVPGLVATSPTKKSDGNSGSVQNQDEVDDLLSTLGF